MASVNKKKKNAKRFERESGKFPLFKTFLLSCEGAVTERQYFNVFKRKGVNIHIEKPRDKGDSNTSPKGVLKRMVNSAHWEKMKPGDEAWIVMDKDKWTDVQISKVEKWTCEYSEIHRDVAISNPKFEYWLLLHFEDVKGGEAAEKCADRLKKFFPGYEKEIDTRKITEEMIKTAVDRAKNRYKKVSNPYKDSIAFTSVYKLVDSILKSSKKSAS